MACTQNSLITFPRQVMEADVCLVDHVPSRTAGSGNVNIREVEDTIVNPDPVIHNEETEQLMEEYISPYKLKTLAGVENLHQVTSLEMVVDTSENSLGNFGNMVENLKQLKLSNSVIASVRDLGTRLTKLETLWMAKCGLSDLDGISSLCSIKELYLAYNDISDVSPISMLDSLEILDLEGNLVEDMAQVEFLVLCPQLKRLTLEGNPVCMKPHSDSSPDSLTEYNYRAEVHKVLPKLTFLDDEPFLFDLVNGTRVLKLTPSQQQNNSIREKLQSDWELVTERIKSFDFDEQEAGEPLFVRPSTSRGGRPGSAARQRPCTAAVKRPSTARQRPSTARQRPGTASGSRPGSGGTRPATAIGERNNSLPEEDDSSDLTHGSGAVICGNPSRALKSRRKNMNSTEENILVLDNVSSPLSDKVESDANIYERDLFEELKSWRREYARYLDKSSPLMIMEDEENSDEDEVDESVLDETLTDTSPSSLSPTPPQRPLSSSPPSSANSRRRVARIRKSYPFPAPPDDHAGQRPRTAAADFRDPVRRQMSSDARLRSDPEGHRPNATECASLEPRGHSAPGSSSRSSPSQSNGKLEGNPVLPPPRDLTCRPSIDPRLRRLRPASAGLASPNAHKWV